MVYAQLELEQPPEVGPEEDPLIWTDSREKQAKHAPVSECRVRGPLWVARIHTQEFAEEHQPQPLAAAHVEQLE